MTCRCDQCVHAVENQDSMISDFTFCEVCRENPNLMSNFKALPPIARIDYTGARAREEVEKPATTQYRPGEDY